MMNDEEILNNGAAPKLNPRLDPFNPENGYDGANTSYSDEFIESYLQTPDKKPELKQVEIDIEKTRLKMKEIGKTLTNLEAVKLSIEQEIEEEQAKRKAEHEEYLKKGIQVMESLDAAGDLREIDL